MSKVIKGIGKVFKKVAKVVKKVAPIALGIGAVVFTAGAAAGAGGLLAGGWGAAASSVSSSLGLSGTLGSVVTGALTQAGYGAATGALTSAVTGGNVLKGATTGAAIGAATGGVSGGLGFNTDPLKGIGEPRGLGSGAGDTSLTGGIRGDTLTNANTLALPTGPAQSTAFGAPSTPPINAPIVPPEVLAAREAGKFALGGQIIQGLGAGLSASGQSKEIRRERERRETNFDTGGEGLLLGDEERNIPSLRRRTASKFFVDESGKLQFQPGSM